MNDRVSEQLDKILALADSDHEGEAMGAVRKARQILEREGLSFSDLARAVLSNTVVKSPGVFGFLTGGREVMQAEIRQLRNEVASLQTEVQNKDTQLDFFKRRVADLESFSQHAQTEAEKWKKLANETADRLWEIARTVGGEEFQASPKKSKTASKRK